MKFCYVFAVLILTVSIAKGNDIQADFRNLNKHYIEMKNYSMDFAMNYFSVGQGVLLHQQGKVVHTDQIHYVNLSGNITLIAKNECIAVNETARLMVYNKTGGKKEKNEIASSDALALVDSLWANQEGLTY